MPVVDRPKLLGISASLRNARWGRGNEALIDSLKGCVSESELLDFLAKESDLHIENFMEAGRQEGKPFAEIYKNLKANKGTKGLCNSEVALAAALWTAYQKGVEIEHISLSEYFSPLGQGHHMDRLKETLLSCDGLILSGPVYFGDRGSLSQSLIDFIKNDADLREHLKGKIYGGIAVGAKRNGGQETTLIYQMLDCVELGLLAIGNDSETASQYGGTCHAGDVGTMIKDRDGLKTAMGVGRRAAKLIRKLSFQYEIEGPARVLFLILQDSNGYGKQKVQELIDACGEQIMPTVIDITSKQFSRCIACDICPKEIGLDSIYRCIISSIHDDFQRMHKDFLNHDAIVPVVVSLNNRDFLKTNYQTFIERTRYLRRGDYVLSDILTAPLIFEEIGVREYYSVRIMTSMIRHHTVITKPIMGYIDQKGQIINYAEVIDIMKEFLDTAKRLAAARLSGVNKDEKIKYNPVGYVLSTKKDQEDEQLKKRKDMLKDRILKMEEDAKRRLKCFKEVS